MNWSGIKENTTLAMETLTAHKFRAALTILGVFIGVLVVVSMAAVLNGFRQSVLDNAESFGTRNVYLWRYPFIMTSKPPAEVLNRKPLSLEDALKAVDEARVYLKICTERLEAARKKIEVRPDPE